MNKFSTTELERMRTTQKEAAQDVGYVQDYAPTTEFGEELEAWTERSTSMDVGIHFMSSEEKRKDNMDVLKTDGKLRLPLGAQVEKRDRIRITSRYGENVTEVTVAIEGEPQEGPSGLWVAFKIVEPGENR